MSTSRLFTPITVGDVTLQHRVVMAPLTRFRNDATNTPILQIVPEYYIQRASEPGTLIISEATFIAAKAAGYDNAPGVFSEEQIAAWKKVTDGVHAKGSFIYSQLWALGRAASPAVLAAQGFDYVAADAIAMRDTPGPVPRALTIAEIKEYAELYATAAVTAVQKAGFDGVELHGGNGYLINQFLEDVSNQRKDEYGGSPENKSRFALEVIDAVVKAVGQKKTAIRLTPWTSYQDSRSVEVIPTYAYLIKQLAERYPDLAYLHIVEPRTDGSTDVAVSPDESNDFIREIWKGKRLIAAGGYTPESALKATEHSDDLIAFGRLFISNPDLPYRIRKSVPAGKGDRNGYYFGGPKGYTDYPFSPEYLAEKGL